MKGVLAISKNNLIYVGLNDHINSNANKNQVAMNTTNIELDKIEK